MGVGEFLVHNRRDEGDRDWELFNLKACLFGCNTKQRGSLDGYATSLKLIVQLELFCETQLFKYLKISTSIYKLKTHL